MRSSTAGIGTPGGAGVIHSPTSVLQSATTPANGARTTVSSSSARATPTWARAWSRAACAAWHAARVWSRALPSVSRFWALAIPSAASALPRCSSRSASSAARQAALACDSAVLTCSSARSTCAFWTESSRRSSSAPASTCAPLRNGSSTTRPPICGDSFARRRALTVPARVLVTVSSTVPGSTRATSTGTGFGRSTTKRNRIATAASAASTRSQRGSGRMADCTHRHERSGGSFKGGRRRDPLHRPWPVGVKAGPGLTRRRSPRHPEAAQRPKDPMAA